MTLFSAGLGLILLGGVAACLFARRPLVADRLFRWGTAAGCGLALVEPILLLAGAPGAATPTAGTTPAGTNSPFGLDPLSAWFLPVVLLVGGVAAWFGTTYLAREGHRERIPAAHLLFSVLLLAMSGVVTARTIVAFLASWEIMAVAGYLLIVHEHRQPGVARSGLIYLILTHVCSLSLVGMFAVWSGGHVTWSFADLAHASAQGVVPTTLVLTLGLVGFGIKAGVVPFHFWLPGAHSAAPSHVSGVLSGVMLKLGIYGLLRMLALLGPAPVWWGWMVLLLGAASSVLGVLWALAQHDLKRLLAYHSVENIGIILLGLGVGALGTAYGQPVVAALGYSAALLHTLNHALFKSLLFLGAGAVVQATGVRELDRLGGLVRTMPRTAAAFLIGSIAIVGLPPLNGFVSEWMVYRGLLAAGGAGGTLAFASVFGAALALTGALALACFAKLFGIVFLGQARDPAVVPGPDADRALALPQAVLAASCAAIGLAPVLVVSAATRTATTLVPGGLAGEETSRIAAPALGISLLSAGVVVACVLLWAVRSRVRSTRTAAESETWACAYPDPSPRMQYTASSFAGPLLEAFGPVSGSREERTPGAFHTRPEELVLERMGHPLWSRIGTIAGRLRSLQSGAVRWYLLYVILCLLGFLLYLGFQARP